MGEVRLLRVVLRLRGTKKNFQARPTFLLKIIDDPFIFATNSFSKIQSTNSDSDGFMWRSWAKMSKFVLLSLRLSGIGFRLVRDWEESSEIVYKIQNRS
jgi:hypothetical protein